MMVMMIIKVDLAIKNYKVREVEKKAKHQEKQNSQFRSSKGQLRKCCGQQVQQQQ